MNLIPLKEWAGKQTHLWSDLEMQQNVSIGCSGNKFAVKHWITWSDSMHINWHKSRKHRQLTIRKMLCKSDDRRDKKIFHKNLPQICLIQPQFLSVECFMQLEKWIFSGHIDIIIRRRNQEIAKINKLDIIYSALLESRWEGCMP